MRGFITAKAKNPNQQEYTVSITLPISDWLVFLDQIRKMQGNDSYPAFHVIDGITEVVNSAHEFFNAEIKTE